jgi:hypothetical protein
MAWKISELLLESCNLTPALYVYATKKLLQGCPLIRGLKS